MLPSPEAKFLATISPVTCRQLCDRSKGGAVMLTSRTKKLSASNTNKTCLQFMVPKVRQLLQWFMGDAAGSLFTKRVGELDRGVPHHGAIGE